MKTALLLGLIGIMLFSACDKDDDDVISLMGKWNVENNVWKEYENGRLVDTYIEQGNGTTMDFQSNGRLVLKYPGNSDDILTYSMKGDTKVEIDGDLFEIRDLTSSSVTLYAREDYAPGEYDEVFLNLKR